MLEDLHDVLADAIGDVPPFSPNALAARLRRRRQRQLGAVAGTAATAIALTVAVARPGDDRGLAVKTHGTSTTTFMTSTSVTTPTGDTTTTTEATTIGATLAPTTTTLPPPAIPQVGDFAGTLTASTTTVAVGDTTTLHLTIRNVTDHVITLTRPDAGDEQYLLLDCAIPDVYPYRGGEYWGNQGTDWTLGGTIAPGETRELVAELVPTEAMIGDDHCTAGVIDLDHPEPLFPPGWSAITAIPSLTITVVASPDSTTTSTSTASVPDSTTTVPVSS